MIPSQTKQKIAGREIVIIPLTKGLFTIIDKKDEKKVKAAGFWKAQFCVQKYYAVRNPTKTLKATRLARLLMNPPKGMVVDHINGITLDNRRSNLRVCTPSENQCNRRSDVNRRNKSGFRGVILVKERGNRWQASITKDGIRHWLGYFDTKEEAINARKKAERKYHGKFAPNAAIQEIINEMKV